MATPDPFTLRLLRLLDAHDRAESLWWRCDDDGEPVRYYVNVNDMFWWATSDAEEITPENIDGFEQAAADLLAAKPADADKRDLRDPVGYPLHWWAVLFAARNRGLRPQRPVLAEIPAPYLPLFLACGPERDPKEEG